MTHITDANIYLIMIVCILSVLQTGKSRMPAIAYALILLVASVSSYDLSGYQYFLFSSFADLVSVITICLLSIRCKTSSLSDILITMAMLSGGINALGALIWHNNQPLTLYYYACMSIYLIAALSMLMKEGAHETGRSYLSSVFRFIGYPGNTVRRFVRGEETL